MKKLLLLPVLITCLSGCVPAALVVGATAGGAIVYDKRSMPMQVKDRNISQFIHNRISEDARFNDTAHVSVATFNQIVLLVGQTQTQELKDAIYNLATNTKYVIQLSLVRLRRPVLPVTLI